jgi:hypothetical protein
MFKIEGKYEKKFIAVFVIVLILSFPLNFSISLASYAVSVNSATGEDGFYEDPSAVTGGYVGYVKYTDTVVFDIQAEIPDGEGVTTDKVRIKQGSGAYQTMDDCGSGSIASCTLTKSLTLSTMKTYTVAVYDNDSVIRATSSFSLIPDYAPPTINNFDVVQSTSDSSSFDITYDVEDTGYPSSSTCVGLSQIQIYTSAETIENINIVGQECSSSGTKTYSSSETDGDVEICIMAVDKFDQESSESCMTYYVDTIPPNPTTLEIFDSSDNELTYVKSNTDVASNIYLTFDSNDISASSVKANLDDLTGSDSLVTADSCSTSGLNSVCEWNSVNININSSKTPSIDFEFSDIYGNNGTASLSGSVINLDDTAPEITDFSTSAGTNLEGKPILTQSTDFQLTFTERDLGSNYPTLDLSNVGASSSVSADECEGDSGTYICNWTDVNIPVYDDYLYMLENITVNSFSDSLGNSADSVEYGVVIDTTPPEITDSEIDVIEKFHNYTVKGSSLDITFTVKDPDDSITAYANLSNLINDSEQVIATCSKTETDIDCLTSGVCFNVFECSIQTNPITTEDIGYIDFSLLAEDSLENIISKSESIFLYGLNNDSSYDYWVYDVTCSPDRVDRSITEMFEFRSYCTVDLEPNVDSSTVLTTVDANLGACWSDDNYSSDYFSSEELINFLAGSTSPLIKLTFENAQMDVNTLSYQCPLNLITKIEDSSGIYLTSDYETLNISMDFELYNLPIGEYSQSMKDKVKSVEDDMWVSADWILSLQKVVNFIETLCEMFNLLKSVRITWCQIQVLLGGNPITYPASTNMAAHCQTIGESEQGWWSKIGTVCKYISCDESLFNLVTDKFLKDDSTVGGMYDKFSKMDDDMSGTFYYGKGCGNTEDSSFQYLSGKDLGAGSTPPSSENCYNFRMEAWPDNPRNSIVLSAAQLCIPGLIDGAARWRQIQCNYGVCLINSMKMNMDASMCDSQKEYMECKFFWGEAFQLIPFASFVKGVLGQITDLFKNPIGLIMSGWGYYCKPLLVRPELNYACWVPKVIFEIMEIANQIMQYFENNPFEAGTDMCDEFETQVEQLNLDE